MRASKDHYPAAHLNPMQVNAIAVTMASTAHLCLCAKSAREASASIAERVCAATQVQERGSVVAILPASGADTSHPCANSQARSS